MFRYRSFLARRTTRGPNELLELALHGTSSLKPRTFIFELVVTSMPRMYRTGTVNWPAINRQGSQELPRITIIARSSHTVSRYPAGPSIWPEQRAGY
jgi:hypothetical protein